MTEAREPGAARAAALDAADPLAAFRPSRANLCAGVVIALLIATGGESYLHSRFGK